MSHRRRGREPGPAGGPARAVLAVCCTALAAGAGGVISGLVPMPSTLAGSAVVAGGPPAAQTAVAEPGTGTGDGTAAGAAGTTSTRAPGGAAAPGAALPAPRPSEPAGRDQDRSPVPSPTAPSPAPSASTSPVAAPTADAPAAGSTATPAPTADAGTAPAPTAASTGRSADSRAAVASAVLTLVNQERAKAGCSPVATDPHLAKLARDFSDDMAARGFFDHTDPDGRSPWDRAAAAGISYLGGENIARGQQTPEEVMDAWMNSPGHRANILNCDYKRLGIGVHEGAGGPWWTQDFGF
ncbi:CAP domain-containing protein [Streptacidiphilus sp. ASG 303]|uniref:CAP domain-containing protein n=1 Tax=Streptacidiphilus sp. ASG 303 TaxID=2896847 RepID=UPI0027E11AE1|nr:CAP domain-containing protein [Streptacidiphilus sp. ASG 303]